MRIDVNFEKNLGPIKPMHAVGQPPLLGDNTKYFSYLSDANIPYSRLHDVAGAYGGNRFVDIPNVFRDFDADENDPASYDFAFTDHLMKALQEHNCQPIYRLGVTIENYHFIKAYRIHPPKDFEKWARICEHVIRHYNEGWANGFHFNVQYWEIWNEPDGFPDVEDRSMWKGDFKDYLRLYQVSASHLKKCFPELKIGGYASCGFYNLGFEPSTPRYDYLDRCFYEFLEFVRDNKLPLDFFSWHHYRSLEAGVAAADFVRKTLDEYGFTETESMLNEWNINYSIEDRGTSKSAAETTAFVCAMQKTKTDMLCYYDAQLGISRYAGMFNPITYEPFCLYYGFKAFGDLYKMGTEVECKVEGENIYAVAASDGTRRGVLVVNLGEKETLTLPALNSDMRVYLIDENHMMEQTELNPVSFTLDKYQIAYIEG